MELIKGRKTNRREARSEEMFRYPATEEIWEVAYVEEEEREQREVPAARKPRNLPIAS
jgi:hypothetical protein